MIKRNKMRGFTLVELLAVIVILAIILVIAVPKIMNTIKDTTKASFESSAKMVAAQVENQYTVAKTLGKEFGDTGNCKQDWAGLNDTDYASCEYEITSDGEALVTLVGSGKFNGLSVCEGTRSNATAIEEGCTPVVNAVSFANDDWGTIIAAVQSGTHPYEVGDTKEVDMGSLGIHTLRVANTTKCSEVEVESKTACGFVLEFTDVISTHRMNGTDVPSSAGGWPASTMRTYVNETIYNALPEELRNGIINTYVVSGHGDSDTTGELENDNFGSIDKLYLLSTEEVWVQGEGYTMDRDTSNGTSRQLDYYATYQGSGYIGVSTTNYEGAIKNNGSGNASYWWLRSVYGITDFYCVQESGIPMAGLTYGGFGVSPAFRLAE